MPRVSKSYPTLLTVHIGQTVTNNATLSAHVSTWFHESGFDTKGNVIESYPPSEICEPFLAANGHFGGSFGIAKQILQRETVRDSAG